MSVDSVAKGRDRLPVWRSVAEAYALTWRNLGYLLRISWAWVAIMLPLGVAFHVAIARLAPPQAPVFGWDIFVAPLLFWPMAASIAVAWHRRLLINESWPKSWYLRFDRIVAGYLALIVLTSFALFIPVFVIINRLEQALENSSEGAVAAAVAAAALTFAIGLYLATRLWLSLPAEALQRHQALFSESWLASRGNVWRIVVGSFLCTALMWIFVAMQLIWEADPPTATQPLIYGLYQSLTEIVVVFLAGMPVVSFLSIAYRHLVERAAAPPLAQP